MSFPLMCVKVMNSPNTLCNSPDVHHTLVYLVTTDSEYGTRMYAEWALKVDKVGCLPRAPGP